MIVTATATKTCTLSTNHIPDTNLMHTPATAKVEGLTL